jgi:hypothetical protein
MLAHDIITGSLAGRGALAAYYYRWSLDFAQASCQHKYS